MVENRDPKESRLLQDREPKLLQVYISNKNRKAYNSLIGFTTKEDIELTSLVFSLVDSFLLAPKRPLGVKSKVETLEASILSKAKALEESKNKLNKLKALRASK